MGKRDDDRVEYVVMDADGHLIAKGTSRDYYNFGEDAAKNWLRKGYTVIASPCDDEHMFPDGTGFARRIAAQLIAAADAEDARKVVPTQDVDA